jgi:hypothetical protein
VAFQINRTALPIEAKLRGQYRGAIDVAVSLKAAGYDQFTKFLHAIEESSLFFDRYDD